MLFPKHQNSQTILMKFATTAARQFQKDFHKLSLSNEIDTLILIDSSKIVIPDNYINKILSFLHKSHSGLEKKLKLAKTLYY